MQPINRFTWYTRGLLAVGLLAVRLLAVGLIGLVFALPAFAQSNSLCADDLGCRPATPIVAHELHKANRSSRPPAYHAVDVRIDKRRVVGAEPVIIRGRLVDKSGAAVGLAPVRVVVSVDGFETPYDVSSDAEGYFALTYRVSGTVTGKHGISVIHPESDERPNQVDFTAVLDPAAGALANQAADIVFAKDLLKTGVSFGNIASESITLKNRGNAVAYQVKAVLTSADGFNWGSITSQAQIDRLDAKAQWPVELRFAPPSSFTQEGVYQFSLTVSYGSQPNVVEKTLPIKVSVTTNEVGGYTFIINDVYTGYSGAGGNSGVADARIRLLRSGVPIAAGAGQTDSNGQFTYSQLPVGFYDYQISADKHTVKNGEIYVRAGVTREERILLEIPVVKVDWSVTETVLEDHYDIVVDATYETDVPQPVLVIEPAVVKLPAMQTGDVINGVLKITNHGLVAVNDLAQSLARSDRYLNYTFQTDALPWKLLPMQTVYLPYRLQAKKDFKLDDSMKKSLQGSLFKNQAAVISGQPGVTSQPKASGTCHRAFGYHKVTLIKGDFVCANGDESSISSYVTFVHTGQRESYTCSGGGGGFYWWHGGGGAPCLHHSCPGGTPPSQPPGMTPCTPGMPCGECCSGPGGSGPGGGGPGGPRPGI